MLSADEGPAALGGGAPRSHRAVMPSRRTALILVGYLLACAALLAALAVALRSCASLRLGEFDGPAHRNDVPTSTTDHIIRASSCEDVKQLFLDAAARVDAAIAGDPAITADITITELEARIDAAVSAELQRFEGVGVDVDCG